MKPLLPAIFLLAVLPVAGVRATQVHKCVAASGAVSYQSDACGEGQRTLWVRGLDALAPLTPASALPRDGAAAATGPASRRTAPARPSPPTRTATARRANPAHVNAAKRCEAARRAADETRHRQWSRLSFRERSALDARVARACRRP